MSLLRNPSLCKDTILNHLGQSSIGLSEGDSALSTRPSDGDFQRIGIFPCLDVVFL